MAYQSEINRVERDILHFFLVSLKFAVGYSKLLPSVEKKKKRKIFGTPYHSIVSHMPVMYRFMSLLSVAAEAEERMFTDVR